MSLKDAAAPLCNPPRARQPKTGIMHIGMSFKPEEPKDVNESVGWFVSVVKYLQ